MQLPRPYFFTSERTVGVIDRPQMAPNEGPVVDVAYGYHTIWIAEVPFIPTYTSADHKEFDSGAANRINHVWQRQGRFLYDLAQSREHLTTFELRFVAWPQANGSSRVGIAFLGKVFHEDLQTSRNLGLDLWDKFSAVFPREAPFSYPLLPIDEEKGPRQSYTFAQWWQPIPYDHLTQMDSIVELRKYEDWPTIRNIGGTLYARDYIPHPFVPALDYSAMARLFETLTRQRDISIVSITLRPQRLTDREVVILHELAGWHQKVAREGVNIDNPLMDALREMKSDIFNSYLQPRAKMGSQVYENLVREHRSLFTVRLQITGASGAQKDLIESLGSEVMANVENDYPSRWTPVEPTTPDEFRWARFNTLWLEFARWGISPLIRQAPTIIRLRQLATVAEAAGAFRLPVAPNAGGLTGIEVRDEPFPLPTAVFHSSASLTIGSIQDRGMPTTIPFTLPLESFMKVVHILGEASKARKSILQVLLGEASNAHIPWVLIGEANSATSSTTSNFAADSITIDTYTPVQQLSINPFLPPAGVALPTFIDALHRVFAAVYQLDSSAAIVLRKALTEAYIQAGWQESLPIALSLSDLMTALDNALQRIDPPLNLQRAIRTRCLLPLQDLALTTEGLFPSALNNKDNWSKSTVIEIGWVGSDINRASLSGCLWAWFSLAFSTIPDAKQIVRGIVGLEEAHTIFVASADRATTAPSATTSLAHNLAQRGICTVSIDDRPDLIDENAIGRAGALILTRITNEIAMEKAAAIIGASSRERKRIRLLNEEEAIIAVPGQHSVLINIQ